MDHIREFRRTKSATLKTFSFRQILIRKCEYNGKAFQLFTGLKNAYNLVKRKNLCKTFNSCGISTKQKKMLITLYLVVSYSKVNIWYLKTYDLAGICMYE